MLPLTFSPLGHGQHFVNCFSFKPDRQPMSRRSAPPSSHPPGHWPTSVNERHLLQKMGLFRVAGISIADVGPQKRHPGNTFDDEDDLLVTMAALEEFIAFGL
jgi:hypothetical protein